jgi:hypothetical protein
MATIATNRATMPTINGSIRVGSSKRKRAASDAEVANIRKAISNLNKAIDATNDTLMMSALMDAFQGVRRIILDNK